VLIYDRASDGDIFGAQLTHLLDVAHWNISWGAIHWENRNQPLFGVAIELGPDAKEIDRRAAATLAKELTPFMVTSYSASTYDEDVVTGGWHFRDKPNVYVTIAPKPWR
jgi:hypothetical protein